MLFRRIGKTNTQHDNKFNVDHIRIDFSKNKNYDIKRKRQVLYMDGLRNEQESNRNEEDD